MPNTLLNLFAGILGLIGISGLGRLSIRPLRPLALHWYAALAMLAGMALSSVSIQCLAMAGSGSAGFRILGAGIVAVGVFGHWIGRGRYSPMPAPRQGRLRTFTLCLLGALLVLLILIGLAPSSKIDELYYHMLTARRVLEDQGLRVYQLPVAQAIVPQMGYQIAQTVFHATNTPDAGNILSLGFGLTLWILIYGVVAEETGRPELGLLAATATAVGVYPAVWYIAAGPHAVGDLATFAGVGALVFPAGLDGSKGDEPGGRTPSSTCVAACMLGGVCAASTKISLAPLGALIAVAAPLRVHGARRIRLAAVAVALWLFVLGPLVTWTYLHTGSPFGAAFAGFFGRTAYQPLVQLSLADARSRNANGLGSALYYAAQSLNGGSLLLIACGAVACCRQWKRFAALSFLVVMQVALIALLLPHDFRFLGGLQYGLLAAGAIGLSALWPARLSLKWVAGASILLLGPWLAAEVYYARPFVAVTLGLETRQDFLDRYVAFTEDFRALDKILPRPATLYIPNDRAPALYAPRPVIFMLADWDRRTPLYRLLVQSSGQPLDAVDASPMEPQTGLACSDVVYRNPHAIVAAYRTPSREPGRDPIVVERCDVAAGAP